MMGNRHRCACIFEGASVEPIQYCSHHAGKRDEIKRLQSRIELLEVAIIRALKRRGSKHPNVVAAFDLLEKALAAVEDKCDWKEKEVTSSKSFRWDDN